MQALNLPPIEAKITRQGDKLRIFDPLRRKHLVLTPEEWVRQHFVHYLIGQKGFPKGLLVMEQGVQYHQRKGRYDAVFLNRSGKPLLLIECKAPDVVISQETIDQAGRYNAGLRAPYMALTNGMNHFFAQVDFQAGSLVFMEEIPAYEYLSNGN